MIVYDSAWVPFSSGTVRGTVHLEAATRARVIYAASGSSSGAAPFLSWSAGSSTPNPWNSSPRNQTPAYPTSPLITGSYAVTGTVLASASVIYTFGSSISGANHLDDWVPDVIYVGITPATGAFTRVIVEAK